MDLALILSAALMGLAGAPHCAAMCSAGCALVVRSCGGGHPARAWSAFLGGRTLGYAAGGTAAATAVSSLGALAASVPALRVLWTMFHLGALALGLWLLATARQPGWLERLGSTRAVAPPRPGGPWRAAAAGVAWVALPCGLLQSALMVAALANRPLGGAAAMAAFALTSSTGLALVPAFAGRGRVAAWQASGWVVRMAGAGLAAASAWALGHGLWERIAAYCAG